MPCVRILVVAALAFALASCKKKEAPRESAAPAAAPAPAGPAWEEKNPIRPLPKAPLGSPADFAALTFKVTPEKVRLGRWLFFDKRLSPDGTVSCATCHRPENGFSEPTPVSTGIRGQKGTRKAPPILNAAWSLYPVFFWDGRAASLQEQAKGPIINPIEMGNTHEKAVATIAAALGYRKYFREAFGDDKVDLDRIVDAIAAYEATRLSGNSAYDRYETGDEKALSPLAAKGRALFFGKGRCNFCHLGPNLADSKFHNLGVGWDPKRAKTIKGKPSKEGFADLGRYAVTKKEEDIGAFKTPTLRDVAKRAPYMHDGSQATLRDVVEHYDKGGNPNPWLSKDIVKLNLTPNEENALVAFMESLNGEGYEDTEPRSFPQ
jgi:cytochrome c peroxidase